MPKSKKDPIRENRISDEVIVDAYGPEEQVMGWYSISIAESTFHSLPNALPPKQLHHCEREKL